MMPNADIHSLSTSMTQTVTQLSAEPSNLVIFYPIYPMYIGLKKKNLLQLEKTKQKKTNIPFVTDVEIAISLKK